MKYEVFGEDELAQSLPRLETSALSDVLDALGFPSQVLAEGIMSLTRPHRMAGRASCVTLGGKPVAEKGPPAPKDYFSKVDEAATEGSVLVLQVSGQGRGAIMGGFMGQEFQRRGAAGVLTNGTVRDVPELDERALPVFASRASPMNGAADIHVLSVGEAVRFAAEKGGHVTIAPGDLVVADGDGVVVVPSEIIAVVVPATLTFCNVEENIRKAISAGTARLEAMRQHDRFAHLTGARAALTARTTSIHSLERVSRGKVRDNYAVNADTLLMVASDRVSVFDVVLDDVLPGKGVLLTQISNFWFAQLGHICPTQLSGLAPESVVTQSEVPAIAQRSVLVKRLTPIPVEAVVRGYLAGSAWKQYQSRQSANGVALPANLRQASRLPEPIFTPVIKRGAGQHDEDITYAELEALVGAQTAAQIKEISLTLYRAAAEMALRKGLIVADTKFEFGTDEHGTITLMDELLTPDSSRFWPVDTYVEGAQPPGLDKQALRDWLEHSHVNGERWNKCAPAPRVPGAVLRATLSNYQHVLDRLVSRP